MLYRILRMTRQLRYWLSGNKDREDRFKLFQILPRIGDLDFRKKLIPLGYQENLFSHTFKGQIATVRKLALDGKHQYHLRLYSDSWVTGHSEMDFYLYQRQHMEGADLRPLTRVEIREIKNALGKG